MAAPRLAVQSRRTCKRLRRHMGALILWAIQGCAHPLAPITQLSLNSLTPNTDRSVGSGDRLYHGHLRARTLPLFYSSASHEWAQSDAAPRKPACPSHNRDLRSCLIMLLQGTQRRL